MSPVRKKILIVTGIFPPEIGGPATLVPLLAVKLVEAGNEVTVITYSNKDAAIDRAKYPFSLVCVERSNKFSNYLRFFLKVLPLIGKCGIVYSFDWFSAGLPTSLALTLIKRPFIVRVGGGYIWEKYLSQNKPPIPLRDFYENGLYKEYKVMFSIIRFVFKKADHIVFNSTKQKELYEKYYSLPKGKVTVITNPVPEIDFKFNRDETKITKEIIFAGRFIKMKNIETALKAFASMKSKDFKFTIIGEGPLEKDLNKLADVLGISSRVSFIPTLPKRELYERIINCYFFIIPSWTDISPNQLYELIQLEIPFLLTSENYLDIDSRELTTISPYSFKDMAQVMDNLTEIGNYKKFSKICAEVKLPASSSGFFRSHIDLFDKIKR
jgi:glycosyltransferase involved in cell wall biosynthesis